MNDSSFKRFHWIPCRFARRLPYACALLMAVTMLLVQRAAGQCSQWTETGAFNLNSPDLPVADMITFDLDGGGPQPAQLIAAALDGVWVWDTVNWRPVGEGLGDASVLTVFNGSLVAGAKWSPGNPVVVQWNGNGWVQMGEDFPGRVQDLAVFQGKLIAVVGDDFSAHYVARLDGNTWTALLSGSPVGVLTDLAVFDLDGGGPNAAGLIVAGYFLQGPPPLHMVPIMATWSGSNWITGVHELPCVVSDFAEFGGSLYACGARTGTVDVGMLARWSGSQWTSVLLTDFPTGNMSKMAVWNGDLVVVGSFEFAGQNDVLIYDGTSGSTLVAGQPEGGLSAVCVFGSNIAVAGKLDEVAQCTGAFWAPVNSSGFGEAFATFGARLVVGGNFTRKINHEQAYNLVGWNGQIPSLVHGGANGPVHALEGFQFGDNQLVVGGSFTRVGEGISAVNVSNIALRNEPLLFPGEWSSMDGGFNAPVLAVDRVPPNQFLGDVIFAGGEFTAAGSGSPTFNRIAQWFGSPPAWSAMGNGFNSRVRAIKAYNSGQINRVVIAGGDFTIAGSVQAHRIAMWATPAAPPGPAWAAMGSGFNDSVHAIERFNSATYAAGEFTASGATTVNRMARWTGTAWAPVGNGTGFNGTVRALLVHGAFLYAAGEFTSVDGIPCDRLARWDGSVWTDAGSESDVPVLALATFHGEVHAGIASDDTSLRYLASTPWLAQQPISQTVSCGQIVSFSVSPAPGYGSLLSTWRKDGVPLVEGPTGHGSRIDLNPNHMAIFNVRGLDAGVYDCVISSAECGSVTSGAATLTVPGTCPPCPADTNGSGAVDVDDLIAVILGWGACPPPPPVCGADVDHSGAVDVDDLIAVILAWGACP
jgi:hypothetical protein